MKNCIITPTYSEHFKYIKKYLKSFDMYVEDKEKFPIYFIINRDEWQQFFKIVKRYDKLNIKILFFEDILSKYNIKLTPNELLNKYDKYCYQTLKKLYTMLYLQYDTYLMIDSESMWIKPTNMEQLFNEYTMCPYFGYSSLSNRKIQQPFQKLLIENINYILGDSNDKWFLETFSWYIDKKVLNDICDKYGTPIELVEKLYKFRCEKKEDIALFEGLLYYQYLFDNINKYNFTVIDIEKELSDFLGENYKTYLEAFYKKYNCNGGIIEFFAELLNENNYLQIAKMFNKYNINIIRLEDSLNNLLIQKKFMKELSPNILVVSQEHFFGLNNTIKFRFHKLVLENKYFRKFIKHLNIVYIPLKPYVSWIGHFIFLPVDLIKILAIIASKLKIIIFG